MKSFVLLTGLCLILSLPMTPLAAQRTKPPRPAQRSQEQPLRVGEMAPAFVLKSHDGESTTDLAAFRERKPVVLIFGSYT
jgi:hypothetical protein